MNKSYLRWMRGLKKYVLRNGKYGNKGWYKWDDWRIYWKNHIYPSSAYKDAFTNN